MKLLVRVMAGAARDSLKREGNTLFAELRTPPKGANLDEYLVRYLAGRLRVATSLIQLSAGSSASHKNIKISARDIDLQPMLEALAPVAPARLFDDV